MKIKYKIFALFLICNITILSQTFLNGSFEDNLATDDVINPSNSTFNSLMNNCTGFGSYGDLDIIRTCNWCASGAIDGNWYVALTGDNSDAISLKLDAPLIIGNEYTISFYDRFCMSYSGAGNSPSPINIGLSMVNSQFGELLYETTNLADGNWNLRTFTFTAPNNGQYITVQIPEGTLNYTWVQLDAFSFGISSVTGLQQIDAPTGISPQIFCIEDIPTISNLSLISGENINWYSSSSNTNALPLATGLTDSTFYYATQSIDGCVSASNLEVLVLVEDCAGMEEMDNSSFLLNPNPVVDILDIELPYNKSIDKILVLNSIGTIVFEQNQGGNQINLAELDSGIYHIYFTSDTVIYKSKFVKK